MQMRESSEDYLEAIFILRERNGTVRAVNVAEELSFSKASVSIAMKKLRENGYVSLDEDGFLLLTPAGETVAARVYQRHNQIQVAHFPAMTFL